MTQNVKKIEHQFAIPDQYRNERLDQVLTKLIPDYSRTQIKTWLKEEAILINQAPAKANLKVKGGEAVTLNARITLDAPWVAQAIPLNIEYEDEAVLIINKPAGLVVHPGANNNDKTLLNALIHHAPQLKALPRGGILHRLDKDTSGLLVIAKTPAALKSLSLQLKKRSIVREYQAIVYGILISGGTIEAPIGRHPLKRKRMSVDEMGKNAITHYRVAEKYRAHTRLKLRLETGRTHQIRVHMQHIHHPIVGDPVYGGRVRLSKGMTPELIDVLRHFKRQALHAFALGFIHPETGTLMRFEIPLPDDFKQLIAVLRKDTNIHEQSD